MPKSDYDVVILGGGPAGLAAAISLRRKIDASVLIVEAEEKVRERVGESSPPDLIASLERLGLAARFREDGHATCPGYASVWGRADIGYNDFIVSPMGPAWRLNRKSFDRMLAQAALEHGAIIIESSRFLRAKRSSRHDPGYVLTLMDIEQRRRIDVRAGYVIDATGPLARFARNIGVKKHVDDRLFAHVRFANVESGKMSRQTLLEATAYGWWYAALLPDNRVINMMVTDIDGLRSLRRGKNRNFEKALSSTTFVGAAMAAMETSNPSFHAIPIYSSILRQMEGEDWIAAGDAASSFDPLAAQGIHKALSNGIAAGSRVAQVLTGGFEADDASYQESIRANYRTYLQNRAFLYGLERRWPKTSFWRDRHRATVAGSGSRHDTGIRML